MKQILTTGLVAVGLALNAFGQGAIYLNNGSSIYGLKREGSALDYYYEGIYGLQVWFRNGTDYDIQAVNNLPYFNRYGYSKLTPDGFSLAGTFVGLNNTGSPGYVFFGQLNMPTVNPAGSPVTIALVAWMGPFSSPVNAVASASLIGMVALQTSTADYTLVPPPTPVNIATGWNAAGVDLIFAEIPEPGITVLAGLGVALFILLRKRGVGSLLIRSNRT